MQSRWILVSNKSKSYALCEIDDPRSDLRPGFHMPGKSQTIGDFGVPRRSGISVFPDDRGFRCSQTIGISVFPDDRGFRCSQTIGISVFPDDRGFRCSQTIGDFGVPRRSGISVFPDDRGCLRFRVFVSRQNL